MREYYNNSIENFKELYENGYRCIFYEIDEKDHFFTVYLKNFENEDIKTIKTGEEEGEELKEYIDKMRYT